jgi:hypothetical protein
VAAGADRVTESVALVPRMIFFATAAYPRRLSLRRFVQTRNRPVAGDGGDGFDPGRAARRTGFDGVVVLLATTDGRALFAVLPVDGTADAARYDGGGATRRVAI